MLHGLHKGYGQVRPTASQGSADEHLAVLELLVATMYADGTLALSEGDQIAAFGAEHGWNTPAFSFDQGFGTAVARVRSAREEGSGGLDALLAETDGRITTPAIRAEIAAACRAVADADGTTQPDEESWLALVDKTFAP